MHLYVSDPLRFFASVIIISFAWLLSNITHSEYDVWALVVRLVIFMINMYQFLTFLVCSISDLTWSLFYFLQGFDCISWSCFGVYHSSWCSLTCHQTQYVWRIAVISGTVHWFLLKTSFHPLLWTSSGLTGSWKLSAYIRFGSLRSVKSVKTRGKWKPKKCWKC